MKNSKNKMVIQLDINEIMYELQCNADEAIEEGIAINDEWIYDNLCDLTLGYDLWEETDDVWYEVYQDTVDYWNAHGEF